MLKTPQHPAESAGVSLFSRRTAVAQIFQLALIEQVHAGRDLTNAKDGEGELIYAERQLFERVFQTPESTKPSAWLGFV
jgi:hypothetical protein